MDTGQVDMIRIGHEAKEMADRAARRMGMDERGRSFAEIVALEGLMIEYASSKSKVRMGGAPLRYASYQSLVLENGDYYRQPITLPEEVEPAEARQCFRNALMLAQSDEDEYIYYEGYATTDRTGIPVLHAWVVSRETGEVIDPTWASLNDDEPDTGTYIGVAFDTEFVLRRTLRTEYWGILGNDWRPDEEGFGFMALSVGFEFDHDYLVAGYAGEAA